MPPRERADQLLFQAGLAESREKAKRMIMAGLVHVLDKGQKIPLDKPGHKFPQDTEFSVKGEDRFVSRGAYKLLTALEHFEIDVTGMVCLDAGASTGGFTDCLLQHGAARVYAVDVGYGQLHWKLRQDPRVVNIERTNMRLAGPDLLPEQVDLAVADVSFISLTKVLPACIPFLKSEGKIVTLIKPQFEVGPGLTDKGVVRSEELRMRAVDEVTAFARDELGLDCLGVVPSRITGPKGNQEYLAHFIRRNPPTREAP